MKPASFAFAAGLALAAIFAVTPHRGVAEPKATPTASATATESPAAIVDTKDFAFSPNPVTIEAGDTVLFKNSDTVGHTVAADDKAFDSGDMPTGATFTHTFEKPGTYAYFCAYHRFMHATIIVK